MLYKLLAGVKVGKLKHEEDTRILPVVYDLHTVSTTKDGKIYASMKSSFLNVLVYNGFPIENENVILIKDEFGYDDQLTKLLIELKPKSLLNILHSTDSTWFDNVD